MTNFDDFADLNAAIAQQLQVKADGAATKTARERLKRGGLSSQELLADQARIAEWERKHEWRASTNVVLFERETCETCQTTADRFVQFMQVQVHRHLRDSHRVVRVEAADAALPNRVYLQQRLVPMCPDCALPKGWLLDDAYEVDWTGG